MTTSRGKERGRGWETEEEAGLPAGYWSVDALPRLFRLLIGGLAGSCCRPAHRKAFLGSDVGGAGVKHLGMYCNKCV